MKAYSVSAKIDESVVYECVVLAIDEHHALDYAYDAFGMSGNIKWVCQEIIKAGIAIDMYYI